MQENRKPIFAKGFTLIEILVVVSIICIIASILFTVFVRVRENGRRSICQSNLRQISLGMQQYVQDHDGRYPAFTTVIGSNKGIIHWQNDVFPYVKSTQIFVCPSQSSNSPDRRLHPNPLDVVDYGFNRERLNIFLPPFPTIPKGLSEMDLPQPSNTWVNADDDTFGPSTKGTSSCGRRFEYYILHSGGSNFSFMDGHVKWLTPDQVAELDCANPPIPDIFKQ